MLVWTKLAFVVLLRLHSIHISYAKAEVNESQVHFKVSYYKDDFRQSLDAWYSGKSASLEGDALRNAEVAYFTNFLRMWSGPAFTHQLTCSTCRVTDDDTSVIIDATFASDTPITMLTIDHRAICKEYPDQMNILTIKIFGTEHNVIANASKPTTTLTH